MWRCGVDLQVRPPVSRISRSGVHIILYYFKYLTNLVTKSLCKSTDPEIHCTNQRIRRSIAQINGSGDPLHKSTDLEIHCTDQRIRRSVAQINGSGDPLHRSTDLEIHCTDQRIWRSIAQRYIDFRFITSFIVFKPSVLSYFLM